MTTAKIEEVVKKIFVTQKNMSEVFGISKSKMSAIANGVQKLNSDEVGKLLTQYHIDPYWFFTAPDTEPLRYNKEQPKKDMALYDKYIDALEKINVLQAEQLTYNKNKAEAQKK